MPEPALPIAAETLLPHKGRMCCIDSLAALRGTEAEATVILRPGHALVGADGRLDPCGFIELAAQAAGTMYGAGGGGTPGLAMLVSIQKVVVHGDARTGDLLTIGVSALGELEGMMSLAFAVKREGEPLAEGRLTVYVPGESGGVEIRGVGGDAREGAFAPGGVPDSLAGCVRREAERGEGDVVTAVYSFPGTFPGFDGHFPGNPIVPGVVQIMIAARTAALGVEARVCGVRRCKFLRPVLPLEEVLVETETSAETPGDKGQCRARLFVGGEPCAEMTFVFVAGGEACGSGEG